MHLGPHLEEILQQLVEDWDRHRREASERSILVIARTHDEIGAFTPFLRQLALTEEQRAGEVTITVAGGNSGSRHKNPRKILVAVDERLVIRTSCRDLGLDSGNLVTVEKIDAPTDSDGQTLGNRRGDPTSPRSTGRASENAGTPSGRLSTISRLQTNSIPTWPTTTTGLNRS